MSTWNPIYNDNPLDALAVWRALAELPDLLGRFLPGDRGFLDSQEKVSRMVGWVERNGHQRSFPKATARWQWSVFEPNSPTTHVTRWSRWAIHYWKSHGDEARDLLVRSHSKRAWIKVATMFSNESWSLVVVDDLDNFVRFT